MTWGHLALMTSLFLAALLELKTREAKLWMIQILPLLSLASATYSWAMYSEASCFNLYYTLGFIVLWVMYGLGMTIGRGAYYAEKPVINLHDRTVTIAGSAMPLALIVLFWSLVVIWEYVVALYPDMSSYRLMLNLNLYFITGLLMGRASYYLNSYARRAKSVQIFGN